MLVAHVKESAVMAQFEASQKRLDAVAVCLPVHALAYAVLHRAMLAVHALIGCRLARLCRFAPPSWSSPGRRLVGLPWSVRSTGFALTLPVSLSLASTMATLAGAPVGCPAGRVDDSGDAGAGERG